MNIIMNPNQYPGKLITFCGLDGCGKTTQIGSLLNFFRQKNQRIFLTKQPTDLVRNSEIFRAFMDTPRHESYDYRALSLLAASDRVQHSNRVIAKHLADGEIVISDRYFYSCLANLRARGYTEDAWIYEIARLIPQPDIAFFLDVNPQTAIERVRRREDEKDRYIDEELQYKLRDEYIAIAKNSGGIIVKTDISAAASFEIILQAVMNKILN